MQKTALHFTNSGGRLSLSELQNHAQDWLLDGDLRQLSPATLSTRRLFVDKLLWFLRQEGFDSCGTPELRRFFGYLSNGHETENGRWDNAQLKKKARPSTIATYYRHLRSMFRFFLQEGWIDASPLETITPPVVRSDQVQPFTQDQVNALLNAAKKTLHARRDTAILLFLLDTGARASEMCGLKLKDVDLQGRRCSVRGKGDKTRSLYFGKETTKALWSYLKEEPREGEDPLFFADRGTRAGDPLTRSGLRQMIRRLGRAARIEACRCSPHTFRHTFAVMFLRAGGNTFTLQQMLGHTSLHMTNRYVALAQADIENQHRQFSPADRLKRSA